MKILTQSMNRQARKTKQIHQAKYDSFFLDKFHIYSRTYSTNVEFVVYEFRKLPKSFKNRDREQLNKTIMQLKTYKNAIVNKMVKDSVRDQRKYFSSFNNIQRISDQSGLYLNNVTTVKENV